MNDPFAQVRQALEARGDDDHARLRLDPNREQRAGIPEIVFAERKSPQDLASSLNRLASASGRALASRLTLLQISALGALIDDALILSIDEEARTAIVSRSTSRIRKSGGRVAVVCAGTSDLPIAREALIMAEEMGCEVRFVADVGVAGLHRLVVPLTALMAWGPDAIVAAAGMDGALPSVIAGLVDVPVVGLPVSVGYGFGGNGEGALMSMLQSCAPGIAVVNIDNGIGAGSMAALIANRVATVRADSMSTESA